MVKPELPPMATHKFGDYYALPFYEGQLIETAQIYQLVRTTPNEACLIHLTTGNRYQEPKPIEYRGTKEWEITQEFFDQLTGGEDHFILLSKVKALAYLILQEGLYL